MIKKRRKLDDESIKEYLDCLFPKDEGEEGIPNLGRFDGGGTKVEDRVSCLGEWKRFIGKGILSKV